MAIPNLRQSSVSDKIQQNIIKISKISLNFPNYSHKIPKTYLFSAFLKKFCRTPSSLVIWFPMVFVSLEFIRSFLFSGFPWELIGYSQFKRLNLIQLSDITGVYGISFLIALVNGSLCLVLLYTTKKKWQGTEISNKAVFRSVAATTLIVSVT